MKIATGLLIVFAAALVALPLPGLAQTPGCAASYRRATSAGMLRTFLRNCPTDRLAGEARRRIAELEPRQPVQLPPVSRPRPKPGTTTSPRPRPRHPKPAPARAPAAAYPDGENRVVQIQNESGESIVVLNARPVTHSTWEENLIEGQFIAAGRSIGADLSNGTTDCLYDLRVGLADGTMREHRQIDVCRISRWVIGASADSVQ